MNTSKPYDLNEVGKLRKMSEVERKILSLQSKIKELEMRVRRLETLRVQVSQGRIHLE